VQVNSVPVVDLRPLAREDAETIASWAGDPEFCAAAEWPYGRSWDHYLEWARGFILDPPPALLRLGAVHEERVVGYVDLHGGEMDRRELGYVIGDRKAWGQGLGTAAAAAGLGFGFTDLCLAEIWAEALDANQPSVRILRRIGMHETRRGAASVYLGEPTFYRHFTIRSDQYGASSTETDPGRTRTGRRQIIGSGMSTPPSSDIRSCRESSDGYRAHSLGHDLDVQV
jgi:RimJ/RimL family protein N-acetyltransferase